MRAKLAKLLSTLFFGLRFQPDGGSKQITSTLTLSSHTAPQEIDNFQLNFFLFSLPLFPQFAGFLDFRLLFFLSIRTRLNYAMTRVHNSWIDAAVRLMLIIVCLIDIQPKVNTKVFFSLPTCKICTIHTNVNLVSLVEELNFHNANRVQTLQSL